MGAQRRSKKEGFKGHPGGLTLRKGPVGVVLLLALWVWVVPGPEALSSEEGISYGVVMEGAVDGDLKKLLEGSSDAITLQERRPLSMRLLQRRIDRDVPMFLKVLRSQGFYGGRVTAAIDRHEEPVRVTYRIDPGPLYSIKSVDIRIQGKGPREKPGVPEVVETGLEPKDPARSKDILKAGDGLSRWFKNRGFPFARTAKPKVVVDHGDQTVAVTYTIDPGPWARFGQTHIEGVETVDEVFLRHNLPWTDGDPYQEDLIGGGHKVLTGLGLFAAVRIEAAKELDERGSLPVRVSVTERKHRSVGTGLSYRTDEGFGGKISWEHRNLFHKGERLSLEAAVSDISLSGEGTFRKPHFLRDDQSLAFSLRLADERPDAYTSRSLKGAILLDRTLSDQMTAGVGLGYKASLVDQLGEEERFSLLSVPVHLNWDTGDDLLDPTRGGRLTFQLAPFLDVSGTDHGFVKGRVGYRRYFPVSQRPFLVLAGRINLGAIGGTEIDNIPADDRFYAGGGGSIRGYAYQSVGPFSSGQPLGGRYLMELSLEMRLKVSDRFGLVGFLDGGGAFTDLKADSDEDLRWGTGLGLRYFTPVGPLRLDVGFPLDRREGVDDSFQVYISLGQAF